MYFDIAIIDTLTPDGVLTSYEVTPNAFNQTVTTEKIRKIVPKKQKNVLDLGGTRIYNSNNCSINKKEAQLLDFQFVENKYSFQFEHMGIPIAYKDGKPAGIYNLVLPSDFRFVDFHIIDPYDSKHKDIKEKKEFQYTVNWDKKHNVQLVEMELRSNCGSFSFIVYGSFIRIGLPGDHVFVKAKEYNWQISDLKYNLLANNTAREILLYEIEKKISWLTLKPNFHGIGLDINKVLEETFFAKKK